MAAIILTLFLEPARGVAWPAPHVGGNIWTATVVGGITLRELASLAGLVLAVLAAAIMVNFVLFRLLHRWASRTSTELDDAITRYCRRPLALILPLIALGFFLPLLPLAPDIGALIVRIHSVLLIGSISWLLIMGIRVLETVILTRYDIRAKDNLKARAIYTQINVFKNIATFVILTLALAIVLMSFEQVRQLGLSLLASAGVAGIIIGFAAQRTIATVLAGIQIAVTQPIRLDDVVIVENEWGWIEEITLTYVVVRIWDLRRLVVPITYFIERPFQNWTRTSADILGSVFVYVDYTIPVDDVRRELQRILEASLRWDRKVCVLQVTNATEKTLELRALMSAADSPSAWDLRCEVREKLIAAIQKNHPQSLPRVRARLDGPDPTGTASD